MLDQVANALAATGLLTLLAGLLVLVSAVAAGQRRRAREAIILRVLGATSGQIRAAWMVGARLALRGIGLVSTIFLARLLRPDDFGLVALAMALVVTAEILGNFSFDLALIREGRGR